MVPQPPRKVILAVALLVSIPVLQGGAEARPRPRTHPPVARGGPAEASPWRGLLALLGLSTQGPPPNLPQAGCEIDPDGKCRTPPNPPTP